MSPAGHLEWQRTIDELSLPLVLGCGLLAFAWLLPGHYLPWTLFQQEVCAAIGGLLLCAAVLLSRASILWPPAARMAFALAWVPWLQFAFGLVRFADDAALPSAYLLCLAAAVCVGASATQGLLRTQLREGLTGAFVAGAVLCGGIALVQWLDLPSPGAWLEELPPTQRPFANLSQPNHLSSVLALGLVGALRWYETRRIGGFATALATAWLAWGIALTQSRTGALFVAVLTIGWFLMSRRATLRVPPLVVLAGALVFAAMAWGQGPLRSAWLQSEGGPVLRTEVGTRLLHWQALSDAAARAPWLGYGWNQTASAQYEVMLAHPATGEVVLHSHNLLLDLVLYNGLALALLLVGCMVAWLVAATRACRDGDSWCLLAALAALLVHAMLEYPLHYLYFLIPSGLLVGMLSRPGTTVPAAASPTRRAMFGALTLLLTLVVAGVTVEYIRTEEALRRLRFATARISLTFADLRSPDVLVLQGWKAYHDAALFRRDRAFSPADLALLRDVARRYPYAPALQRYAYALASTGDAAQAREVLARICKGYPEPIQDAVREEWLTQQQQSAALRQVEFPACRG